MVLTAVAVMTLGKGKVALSGPHLEADHQWFQKARLKDPNDPDGSAGHATDLAGKLIDELMK